MALQVPQHLEGRSPEYLYQLMKAAYERKSQVAAVYSGFFCSQRPYGLEICETSPRNNIRYGTFNRCKMLGMICSSGHFYSRSVTVNGAQYQLRAGFFAEGYTVGGKYGIAMVDETDTQFVAQVVHKWSDPALRGNEALLGSALQLLYAPQTMSLPMVTRERPTWWSSMWDSFLAYLTPPQRPKIKNEMVSLN